MSREELIARLHELLKAIRGHSWLIGRITTGKAAATIEAALTALQSEHLAPEDDAKAKRRCKCEFSGGGVWAKKCAFHAAYLSERSALEQEAVVRKCAAVCEELDELLHAEMGNYDPSTGAVELPTRYTDISDAYDSCKFEILKILEKP